MHFGEVCEGDDEMFHFTTVFIIATASTKMVSSER